MPEDTAQAEIEELEQARKRCEEARWPEHHDPRCAWCEFVARSGSL